MPKKAQDVHVVCGRDRSLYDQREDSHEHRSTKQANLLSPSAGSARRRRHIDVNTREVWSVHNLTRYIMEGGTNEQLILTLMA